MQYSMTCSCGHGETLEAANQDDAISKFKVGMTQAALDDHFGQHHSASEQKPTLEQAHAMIGQMTKPATTKKAGTVNVSRFPATRAIRMGMAVRPGHWW